MSRLTWLIGSFTGRSDRLLVDRLVGQLDATTEGAALAMRMSTGQVSTADAHEQMGDVEHAGDTMRGQLVEALARCLATPIDREDLFRLSRSIDDVLDTLRDFVRESHLYAIPNQERFGPLLSSVLSGVDSLEVAVKSITEQPSRVARSALAAKKASGAVRRLYQHEISRLFDEPLTPETFKTRELLRRLDVVALRLSEAADALADGAMKRWS